MPAWGRARKVLQLALEESSAFAGVVKRSNTADCKSVGIRLRGFESLPPHQPRKIGLGLSPEADFWRAEFARLREVFGVRTACGSSQGNLPMTTCWQSRSFGLAESESNPSLRTMECGRPFDRLYSIL